MKFIPKLQKGGSTKPIFKNNDGDEYSIPTKKEGGVDMNPKDWKKESPKLQAKKEKPKQKYISSDKKELDKKAKGGSMGKKCSCGCAMKISKNAKGGLIEVCSCKCGGKLKKKK